MKRPKNPTPEPVNLLLVKRSFLVKKWAKTKVNKGAEPHIIAASELSIDFSPTANNVKGTALWSKAAMLKCFQTDFNFGNFLCLNFRIVKSKAAPMPMRIAVRVIGGMNSMAILMKRKEGPQSEAKSKRSRKFFRLELMLDDSCLV